METAPAHTMNTTIRAAEKEVRAIFGMLVGMGLGHLADDKLTDTQRAHADLILEPVKARIADGNPPPDDLVNVLSDAAVNAMLAVPRGRGRLPYRRRDLILAAMVKRLVDQYGLKATRSSGKAESACSIIARVLGDAGINLDQTSVQNIWARERHRESLPLVFDCLCELRRRLAVKVDPQYRKFLD